MNTLQKRRGAFLNTLLLLFIFLELSCNNTKDEKYISTTSVIINIQPFADISKEEKDYVFKELKKVYPYVELNQSIELPQSAYYDKRNRYRADSLINYLSRNTADGHVTIGLIRKDISTTKGSIADWGVIGLGFCPGKACIASTFRLKKNEKLMQLFKVAIHELGHTEGLPHCPVKTCFMRDAEGKNPTNEEKEFCAKCKAFLVDKGWQFR